MMTKTQSFIKQLIHFTEILIPFFILVLPSLIFLPLKNIIHLTNEFRLIFSEVYIWLILITLYLYVVKKQRQKFLLWTEKEYSILYILISIVVLIFIIFIGSASISLFYKLIGLNIKPDSDLINRMLQVFKANKILLVFSAITAGFTEELLFRGYLMPRIELIFNKPYLTIIIPTLLFGILHFNYGNIPQIIGPGFIGLIFALHYYKYRNIKILIFSHFLWDFIAMLIKANYS